MLDTIVIFCSKLSLAALKSRRQTPSPDPPADSVSTDQSRRQSTKPESGKERGSTGILFGIALDQALLRWAAAEDMTETESAVSLLHERSVEEIAGKLTPAELADVTRLVSRCPSCYPHGAYDALKAWRNAAAERLATRTTAGTGAKRPREAISAYQKCVSDTVHRFGGFVAKLMGEAYGR